MLTVIRACMRVSLHEQDIYSLPLQRRSVFWFVQGTFSCIIAARRCMCAFEYVLVNKE
jgi:hypothetical protein